MQKCKSCKNLAFLKFKNASSSFSNIQRKWCKVNSSWHNNAHTSGRWTSELTITMPALYSNTHLVSYSLVIYIHVSTYCKISFDIFKKRHALREVVLIQLESDFAINLLLLWFRLSSSFVVESTAIPVHSFFNQFSIA